MAEMVSSAVAQEAVNQVLSRIQERCVGGSDVKDHMERLEMAHIRLEAALEASAKWTVTSAPLLRWRRKLKRAARECDDELRGCKQRFLSSREEEGEETGRGARRSASSLPKRLARTARSLVSSVFNRGGGDNSNNEPSGATVRRFEWFADSSGEFLRYVELGGTPRRYTFLDPLVRHLLAGKAARYYFTRGSQRLMLFARPFTTTLPEHGTEGGLLFLLEDGTAPENSFLVAVHMRLSESTDMVGVVVRCMQLFAPHSGSTADAVRTRLTQLPTQDLSWVPCSTTIRKEHWEDLHAIFCRWSRSNPLCCQQHCNHYAGGGSTSSSSPGDVYMEPVTEVYLQGHVRVSASKRRAAIAGGRDSPSYLKLGGLFSPHAPSEDLLPAVGASATEMIDGEEASTERGLYANIPFEQLGEIMLTKGADRLCENAAATCYQMLWKSRHGGAYLRLEKALWAGARNWSWSSRGGGKRLKSQSKKVVHGGTSGIGEFVSSWGAHAPPQLQGSIADWVRKERQMSPYEEVMMPPTTPTEQLSSPVRRRG